MTVRKVNTSGYFVWLKSSQGYKVIGGYKSYKHILYEGDILIFDWIGTREGSGPPFLINKEFKGSLIGINDIDVSEEYPTFCHVDKPARHYMLWVGDFSDDITLYYQRDEKLKELGI